MVFDRQVAFLAVCLALLVAPACGGGDAADSSAPAVGTAFAAKATAECQRALTQKHAEGPFPYPDFNPTQPDPSKFPGMVGFFSKAIITYGTWLQNMQALGPPPGGQDAWSDLVDQIGVQLHLHKHQRAAAVRGDATTFTDDYYKGVKSQDALESAAEAAGVPECARVVQ